MRGGFRFLSFWKSVFLGHPTTHEYNFLLKVATIHITSLVQGCHVVVLLSHVRRRKGWKWVWLDGGPRAPRLLLPRTEEEDSTTLGGASSPFLLPPKEEDSEENLHHSFSYDDRASKFSSNLRVGKKNNQQMLWAQFDILITWCGVPHKFSWGKTWLQYFITFHYKT